MEREQTADRKFTVQMASPGQCQRVLSIDVPEDELARERDLVLRALRRDVRVPGFRKGKVPTTFIEKNYADVIHGDAVRNLLPVVYEKAVIDQGIVPLGEPRFENIKAAKGEGLRVEAHVEVRPEVKVDGYRGLKVEVRREPVGDAQVDQAIDNLRERLATLVEVERDATASDYVIIDYVPYFESGVIDEKSRQKNYPVELAGEQLLPEFRDALLGTKKGDTREIEVQYSPDFPEKALAGKKRRFSARVLEIKEKLLPEADDAFARKISERFADLSALREEIRKDLTGEEEKRFRHEVVERAIDLLIAKTPFEVPEVMVSNYLASILEEDRRRRPRVADETAREKEVREVFRDVAVRSIRKYFVLDAVRRQEDIAVNEEDVEKRIAEIAESAGRPAEEVREVLKDHHRRHHFEDDLLDQKVLNFMRENADIRES